MTFRTTVLRAGTALFALGLAPAPAAALTADDLLFELNLIVFGDVTASSEVEGRTLIGGNLSGPSATFFTRAGLVPPSTLPALAVGGSVTGGFKNVNGGGDAWIVGDVQNMNMNGGKAFIGGGVLPGGNVNGARETGASVSVPDVEAVLLAASDALAGLTGGAPTLFGSRAIFDAAPGLDGRAVFSIDADDFLSWGEVEIRANGASTVLINVTGAAPVFAENMVETARELSRSILWNFPEATSLGLVNGIYGSVLAPRAGVSILNPVEGTLVAASLALDSEVHLQAFAGTTVVTPPESNESPPAPTVPVPAAAPLMGLAIAALALAGRRRARRG